MNVDDIFKQFFGDQRAGGFSSGFGFDGARASQVYSTHSFTVDTADVWCDFANATFWFLLLISNIGERKFLWKVVDFYCFPGKALYYCYQFLLKMKIFNLEQVLDLLYFTLSLWEVIIKLVFIFFRTTYWIYHLWMPC